jgi:Zn-dependent metalloprotease
MRRFTVTLILLLVSPLLALAQDRPVPQPPDSARQAAAAQFQQEHGPEWRIAWHEKAGTPATLMNGTARGYAGPPEKADRAFLKAHKQLFGIENARRELEVARTNRLDDGGSRVQYQQVHRGIPVLNSGYLVALNSAGAVHYVSGDFYPDLQVDTSPRLQPSDVVETMQSDLGGAPSFKVRQEPLLSIFVDDRGEELTAHLAYEARAGRRDPLKGYKYVVDAHSGDVLQKISLIETIGRPERPHATNTSERTVRQSRTSSATGSGDVYLTNPLHGSPTSVTLHRLNNVSPQVLEGDNIAVTNEEASDAESSTGDFTYSPSNTHFDEVMTYYHSDEFEAWLIGDLGMATDQLSCEVSAETHSSDVNFAATDASTCEIWFNDENNPLGFGNPTRERVIIAHEYMHDVSETYNGLNQDFDAEALDEGYSDFFAVADRHANTGVSSARLGASVDFDPKRTVDNDYQLGEFKNEVDLTGQGGFSEHDGGVVLAGALWDFKQAVNDATLAAEITLASLNYLDSDPSFFDARYALLTAADGTGNSQYECDIRHAFADHGIGTGVYTHITSGPTTLDEGETGTWTASAYCPDGSPSYTWSVNEGAGWYQIGTGSSVTWGKDLISSTITVDLKVEVAAGGESNSAQWQVIINDSGGGGGGGGGCNAVSANQICLSAEKKVSALGAGALPDTVQIGTVAPNPVRSQAGLSVALPEQAEVEVALYNTVGQEVRRHAVTRSGGRHALSIGVEGLSSGVYFARVRVGDVTATRRIVVVR